VQTSDARTGNGGAAVGETAQGGNGANGGNATIKGLENELQWAATDHMMLSTNFTFLNPYLTQNYCGQIVVTNCPTLQTYYAFDFPGAVKQPGGEYMWIGPQAPTGGHVATLRSRPPPARAARE